MNYMLGGIITKDSYLCPKFTVYFRQFINTKYGTKYFTNNKGQD